MKNLKTLLLAVTLFVGMVSTAQAQSKVAHINTQELIASMPSMKSAQSQLQKMQKTYENEIKNMATSLQNTMKQYQAEAATKTDEENTRRANEVQTTQQTIMQYEQNAQQELAKKQEDLIKPVMEQARVAIQKVARAQGFQYVIDSTNGSGLILADGKDLLSDVKKELGIQ